LRPSRQAAVPVERESRMPDEVFAGQWRFSPCADVQLSVSVAACAERACQAHIHASVARSTRGWEGIFECITDQLSGQLAGIISK
jgi:hypothetical protein